MAPNEDKSSTHDLHDASKAPVAIAEEQETGVKSSSTMDASKLGEENKSAAEKINSNMEAPKIVEELNKTAEENGSVTESKMEASRIVEGNKSMGEAADLAALNQLDLDESSRSMAKVVKLGKVSPHPNADRLAIAEVGGWRVVVPIDSREGDVGVYFEIDSILPEATWHNVDERKRKIKTLKLRGELSQGLFLPRSDKFPVGEGDWVEGADLTRALGIEKRIFEEPGNYPMPRGGVAFSSVFGGRGPSKTDEPRVQSSLELLEALRGLPFYIAEKVDGASGPFGLWDGELKVCSRNLGIAREDETSKAQTAFWAVAELYNLRERLARNPDWILQGEVHGPGLQKNKCRAKALQLALFNVWSIQERRYLDYEEFVEAARVLDIPTVRILEEGEGFGYTLEELLEKARGKYPGTDNFREGIVVRPKKEVARARMAALGHSRLSFKVINNDFLLKYGQ